MAGHAEFDPDFRPDARMFVGARAFHRNLKGSDLLLFLAQDADYIHAGASGPRSEHEFDGPDSSLRARIFRQVKRDRVAVAVAVKSPSRRTTCCFSLVP
jgi:hypothetical protein